MSLARSPLASSTLSRHLARGCGAVLAFAAVVMLLGYGGPLAAAAAVAAGLLGVILLRGCPTCWLIGLFEIVAQRRRT